MRHKSVCNLKGTNAHFSLRVSANQSTKLGGEIMATEVRKAKTAPIIFFTNVRKVEPIGSECVRIYLSIATGGEWEDRVILETPMQAAMSNSSFVISSIIEMNEESQEVGADETGAVH